MDNINTKTYWDKRFKGGSWEVKKGRWQTTMFANTQVKYFEMTSDFNGTIVDFGCGLGDAIPIYKKHFPNASIIGIDHSSSAIENCKAIYGRLATFIAGDYNDVPVTDVIISSNVFEHLTDDKKIAEMLLKRCKDLYVTVPYKEWPLFSEHVNTYDEHSFNGFPVIQSHVFLCKGWSAYGFQRVLIGSMNVIRFLTGRRIRKRGKQIMFHLKGNL